MLVRCPASTSTFLWSPQNRGGKIELPPLPIEHDLFIDCICLLSNKPTASNCVVLLVEPYGTFIWYCYIGDDQWQKHDYYIGTQPLFYFNSTQIELGVLEFCPAPVFSSITINDVVDDVYGVEQAPAQVFLVESDGELYMVSVLFVTTAKTIYGARVHRMDFSKRQWRKVYDLGDRAFLLSLFNSGALCSVGESGLRENCIYMAYPWEQTLHIFSVEDGSMDTQKLDEAPSSDKANP
ncbi:hypothetical protein VPH35_034668 [Triticum aestivum]